MPIERELRHLPTLAGQHVHLRAHRDEDVGAVHAVFSDPAVMRYWSRPVMTDRVEVAQLLREVREHVAAGSLLQWGIATRADDHVIGHVSLFSLSPPHRRAEIGYALASAHWGRGLAREALTLALQYAFDALGMERIEADIDPRNEASTRLVERLGFKREGLLRQRWLVAGELQDSAMYGLLRSDYVNVAKNL